jgi:hypothetical protein
MIFNNNVIVVKGKEKKNVTIVLVKEKKNVFRVMAKGRKNAILAIQKVTRIVPVAGVMEFQATE